MSNILTADCEPAANLKKSGTSQKLTNAGEKIVVWSFKHGQTLFFLSCRVIPKPPRIFAA